MARATGDATVFHAIACPTRRALLDALAGGERNVSALVAAVALSQSAVSQQLAVLTSAGLVAERAAGRFRFYRLRPEPLAEVLQWADRYRALMEAQLDALGQVLDQMDTNKPKTKRRRR